MTADEASVMSAAMVRRFLLPSGQLAWSSFMIESALAAISTTMQGAPPEPLLRATWELLAARPLDRNTYEFCRALGLACLAGWRRAPGWDLRWMLVAGSDAQVCLRYFTLGLAAHLWTDELEREATTLLREMGGEP